MAMSSAECPLSKLAPGDWASNSYIAKVSPLGRIIFRINCSECDTGYTDFLGTNSRAIPDDPTRFELQVERVIAVYGCSQDQT